MNELRVIDTSGWDAEYKRQADIRRVKGLIEDQRHNAEVWRRYLRRFVFCLDPEEINDIQKRIDGYLTCAIEHARDLARLQFTPPRQLKLF